MKVNDFTQTEYSFKRIFLKQEFMKLQIIVIENDIDLMQKWLIYYSN